MDLQAAWNQLSDQKFEQPFPSALEIDRAINAESVSYVASLKKRVLKKFYYAMGIWALFIAVTFVGLQNPDFLWVMSVIHLYYGAASVFLYLQYRKISPATNLAISVKEYLLAQYTTVKTTLKTEELVSLFFYPIAGICGMSISLTLSGMTLATIFSTPLILWSMAIFAVVATPLCHWLAIYLNKCAFRKLLDKLKANIEQLEDPEA